MHNHPKIEKLLEGDSATIKLLYSNLFPMVVNYVKKNSGSYENAEEVFQEALFQLIVRAKAKGVTIKSSFEAYVFTVCKNIWLQELNKRKKVVRNDYVFEHTYKDEETIDSIINQERQELFEEALSKLTDNCSKLLKAYFNKVPYTIIVKKFSYATENTAFQRVFKCKKKLMELVKKNSRYQNLRA